MISSRHIDTVPVTLYAISKALAGRFVARTELSPVAVCGAPQAAFLRAAGVTARGCGGFAPHPGRAALSDFRGGWGLPQIGVRPGAGFSVVRSLGSGRAGAYLIGPIGRALIGPMGGTTTPPIGCFVLCASLAVPGIFIVAAKNISKKKHKKVLTSMDNVCIIFGRR